MQMLSEDDRNLKGMTAEELDAAWDLWFDLAQSTNDSDPPYEHAVFAHPERPHASPAGGRRGVEPGPRPCKDPAEGPTG
jgi:hypothetical protein